MIPAGGFLLGEAPINSGAPNYQLPQMVVLAYRGGAVDFVVRERVPPFGINTLTTGSFEGVLLSGEGGSQFGFRTELRRRGVYGTILIDRLDFDVAAIQLSLEDCPDITNEAVETSVPVTLTGEEACPHITVPTEEVTVPISSITSDK